MEARPSASSLQGQVATLPGGRDKEGRPILLVTIPQEAPPPDIAPSLQYLLSVFSSESRARGVTVLLDARKGPWKTARAYIRQVNNTLTPEELGQLIVVRPDAFWDKQRVENCTSTQKDGQVIFTPPSRLNRFVEQSQLPLELGGCYIYNHSQWIENRLKADEYFKESATALKDLEEFHQHLLNNRLLRANEVDDALNTSTDMAEVVRVMVQRTLEGGQALLQKIEHDNRNRKLASESDAMSTPRDILDAIQKVEAVLSGLRAKQCDIEEAWRAMEKSFGDAKDLSALAQGIVGVINWILGPAENLLNSQHKVGYDVSSAEELRNEHEAVELQCWDTYGAYAELLHKIDSIPSCEISPSQRKDLIWQKDFMDFVCRSFATRLERRRNVLITSLRFFRLVSEYFDRTSEVFESLVMGNKIGDFSTAKQKLRKLQESQQSLDAVERELVKEGEKLSDMLSMPVKDALGRELTIDYSEDIVNIRDVLDATNARKNLFSDSVELQKLTLEQVTHIDAYEKDAEQAIQWLDELFQVMLQHHGHVGITVYEIQAQKDEHQAFQETAKDTYNYGCQLLNASLVLRQSCKLPTQEHSLLYKKLCHSWQRLLQVSQEQMTRLRVSAVFHRSVEEHCNQLRDLREAVATMPLEEMSKKQVRVRNFYSTREKLLVEVGRMVRLGKLLRSRLREPIYLNDSLSESGNTTDAEKASSIHDPSVEDNVIAVEAISERLVEVTDLAEELDQALHSAQQDCGLLTTSSTSTSGSTTPTTIISMSTKKAFEGSTSSAEDAPFPLPAKPPKPEDLKSDEEFLTASECTLPHSRSSSYNTASECEHRFSPWWEYDKKDTRENIAKEKMVLGVGLPDLPAAKAVLKPSPEVPPGKMVREVTETTHLKVLHSHSMGVASYVLTSEIAREKDAKDEVTKLTDEFGKEIAIPVLVEKDMDEEEFLQRMKQCGDWLQLKILEVSPELTALGDNLAEALELQKAHEEVLHQLQNKQSPVEELLRQADQLISTQKPRAEVYAAMAESLGKAWKDINLHLELRKQILDLNVQYHTKAQEFFERLDALERACADTVVPIDAESIKRFLTNIHDLRRSLLESLMSALQTGNSILGKLRELGAEGTLDSRPDRIRCSVNRAISQVQGWLDELHARRQVLELTFTSRKTQLEQCLALAILASDLKELEDSLRQGREVLKNTDHLGDSSSSAELLHHEHKKLLPEAKQLQERALKLTKATEQLVASGCFAGEQATRQAYTILSETSDYLTELEQRSSLLERVIAFFRAAQAAVTKLDQLEVQLATTELPSTSPQLAQLHAQCARTVEEVTSAPIAEGYAILDAAGRGKSGTEGVKRMVEELENKKIYLDSLCTAHREEKLRINQALNSFLETQNELYSWLVSAAEAFLQGHQDMGSDLPMAKDFWDLHNRLLNDLQTKGNEINALLLTLPPVLEFLEDNQRRDVDSKVEDLHQLWLKLKSTLETRLDLSAIYVKFHTEADYVNKAMDRLEEVLRQAPSDIDDDTVAQLEQTWESLVPLYQSAKNTGLTFINAAHKVCEPHLDTKRACVCVESVLEKLSGRQLAVTRNWQSFQTNVVERRELLVQLEINMVESTKTINWVSKLDTQLFPVITTNATSPKDISAHLEQKLETVLPEIKRAQNEVEQRIKTAESLIAKNPDEQTLNVKNKLIELNQKLVEVTTDYQVLLQMLIAYFNNIAELDKTISNLNAQFDKVALFNEISGAEQLIREHDASKQAILEMFKFTQNECDKITNRINRQEPRGAAEQDIEKLQHILKVRRDTWESEWRQRRDTLDSQQQLAQFDADLKQINETVGDLSRQVADVRGQYGESLSAAKATSQAFGYFEKTVEMLGQRIETFVNGAEKLLAERHVHSPHIEFQVRQLKNRWDALKKQVEDTRRLINLSIQYFQLVDDADEWFKHGSHLLVTIARKATAVKRPEEAQELLNEIQQFLKPGEAKQDDRIEKITSLAKELYGHQLSPKSSQVVVDNREMLESFTSITKELHSLALNLKTAQEERERAKREQEEADAKLAAARAEAEAARLAALAAEEAKRAAELEAARVAEQAKRAAEAEAARAAEEAKKAAEAEAARRAAQLAAEEVKRAAELQAARVAEQAKRAAEAEAARAAEEAKKAAEAEAARRAAQLAAEEAKRAAELQAARVAEQAKRAAEAEAARAAEEAKKAAEAEAARRAAQLAAEAKNVTKVETITGTGAEVVNEQVITKTVELVKVTQVQQQEQPVISALKELEKLEATSPVPVLQPPVFISPLSDAVIQEGSKFSFICQVTGEPKPTVVWYKDGIAIQNNPDYQTSFEDNLCTLTIEETFAEDSARYICKAINPAGSAETGAFLRVKETHPEEQLIPPTFIKLLQPAVTKQGQKFQFECKVQGNPLPTVQWFKNADCIDNSPDYAITYNNGDALLKFDEVLLEDKADYTCKASNQVGIAQTTANLCVEPAEHTEAPIFVSPLSNVMARAGQKIKLECEVLGLPAPSLTWSHNGKPVKETRELKLQSDGKRATLVISEAFPKDAGTYIVTATNAAGEATSTCNVTVKGRLPTETSDSELASDMEPIKPSIQVPLKDLSTFEGKKVCLDCVIVGQPEPEVIWYHDDRPVKESPDFQLLFQGDRCSLVIREAFAEDAGEYKVVALNSAGEASSKCSLTVTPLSDAEPAPKPPQEETKPTGSPPKFSKLLSDVLVSEGDKVIFEAAVTGDPRPEVKWLLNNHDVQPNEHIQLVHDEEGNVRLEIDKVKPEDKGVYTVKATNSSGDAKCFAQLIVKSFKPAEVQKEYEEVKSAPAFKEAFADRTAFEETATKFECIVTGKPTPKIKWLFNDEPVAGKNFLISTSGERQVVSIPSLSRADSGKITCVAENEAGKATCTATLTVQPISETTLPEQRIVTSITTQPLDVSSFTSKKEVFMQSSTSSTSKIVTSSTSAEPQVAIHGFVSQDSQSFKQVDQQPPEIKESHVKEEFHKVGNEPPVIQEKSVSTVTLGAETKPQEAVSTTTEQTIVQKTVIKSRPPKFTNPIVGKIVDQGVDVTLEGILDGYPTPKVTWSKNGSEIQSGGNTDISFDNNRVTISFKSVTTNDSGRYTCTAVNEAGTAVSTSDLVVRKTIFPPVFGRRLQAQVVKKGDRVHMEVEVTGTPIPTITWFKDDKPISEVLKDGYKVTTQGNSHILIIEKADFSHTGKYMARAVNEGGEAQSIADFAVFEPTPDTMVEVVKTVVFEDVHKHETLAQASDHTKSTFTSPQPIPVKVINAEPLSLTPLKLAEPETIMHSSESQISKSVSSKAEFSTITETQISQESKTIRLESNTAGFSVTPEPRAIEIPIALEKKTSSDIKHDVPIYTTLDQVEDTGIQTSSISKQSSLDFFVQKMKECEEPPKPKELPKGIPLQPDIYTKFEDISKKTEVSYKPEPEKPILFSYQDTKIPTVVEQQSYVQQTKQFEHYQKPEIISLPEYQPPIMEVKLPTFQPPPVEQKVFTQSKHFEEKQYQQFSSFNQQPFITSDFNLQPEPPAEICYTPRREVASRVQKIEEAHKELPPPKPAKVPEKSYLSTQTPTFQPARPTSPKPSAEGLEMEKLWVPHKDQTARPLSAASSSYSVERHSRPISAASEPSVEALAMEKTWAHKFSESHTESSWPPPQSQDIKSWSAQTTLEKKWAPIQKKTESYISQKIVSEPAPPAPVMHYIAKVTDLHETEYAQIRTEHKEQLIEEYSTKASEIIKSWPPAPKVEEPKPVFKPTVPSIHSLSIRPASVQDITDEVYLEPGPPPEIGYAQPPPEPPRAPSIRTVPPPLPPKQERPLAPPLPARPIKHVEPPKKFVPVESKPFERFPELEPFPFKAGPEKLKYSKAPPPPTPSKFIKGKFGDSDYESDFESIRIPAKWKPCSSDTEEPAYRRVRAPKPVHPARSRSVDPEPLPPSKFEQPSRFVGSLRPTITTEDRDLLKKQYTASSQVKKQVRSYTRAEPIVKPPSPPPLKPGTPPEYLEAKPKPDSPKLKARPIVDGYMADTDEPFTLRKKTTKTEYEYHSSENLQQKVSSSTYSVPKSSPPKVYRKHVSSASSSKKELVATPIITSISTTSEKVVQNDRDSNLEPFPFKAEPAKPRGPKGPPPPSPSKFVKGEFRESDYESDYEGRIPPVWRSGGEPCYKPVRPVLTPSGRQSQTSARTPTPPTEFDQPPQFSGPPRPKFEPIEKPRPSMKLNEVVSEKSTSAQVVHKPKPVTPKVTPVMDVIVATPAVPKREIVIQPGTPPEIGYAPEPKVTQYYRSTTSAPYQNAVQTETSNVMHFKESTEHSHRTMSVQQTRKVITFGSQQQKQESTLEPFPFKPEPERSRRGGGAPPPTPKKFVKGEFRESDYDSEVESTRIKSLWIPGEGDIDGPRYRKVKAPQPVRSHSVPATPRERILSPMEFDTQPPVITKTTDSIDSKSYSKKRFEETKSSQITSALKPGSPPEYGYVPEKLTRTAAASLASKHMDDMTQTFRSKTQQFSSDIMTDMNVKSSDKPLVKRSTNGDAQVYREESRAAQYGTKHVDPDTGLIYFKYDFGYEFGIILPGQSKGGEIPVPKKTIIEPPKRSRDIEMPVYHETTQPKQNSYSPFRPNKIPAKTVKWEPTSESEMSEYEGDGRKKVHLYSPRWEPSSVSPVSLSPSLPSTSPAFNTAGPRIETPTSTPSTPGSMGQKQDHPKRPPLFITPLRDIAVVSGQSARFECIVQSEPPPTVLWSKNGRILENSNDHQIHFRNGVCRLTIPQAFPEDAGTYTCTATNQVGAVGTTATLQVPGERRSQYIK